MCVVIMECGFYIVLFRDGRIAGGRRGVCGWMIALIGALCMLCDLSTVAFWKLPQQGFDLNPPETRFRTDTERDSAQSRTLSSGPRIEAEEIRPEFESLTADLRS